MRLSLVIVDTIVIRIYMSYLDFPSDWHISLAYTPEFIYFSTLIYDPVVYFPIVLHGRVHFRRTTPCHRCL